jgi:hypothetical protein
MSAPTYLIQTADGVLHSYWNGIVLRIHLRENRGESVKLFRLCSSLGRTYYEPVSVERFLEAA